MSDSNLARTVATAAATPDGVTGESLADAALLARKTLTVLGVELELVESGWDAYRLAHRMWRRRTRDLGFALEVQVGYHERWEGAPAKRPWALHVTVGERASVCAVGGALAPLEVEVHALLVRLAENLGAFTAGLT